MICWQRGGGASPGNGCLGCGGFNASIQVKQTPHDACARRQKQVNRVSMFLGMGGANLNPKFTPSEMSIICKQEVVINVAEPGYSIYDISDYPDKQRMIGHLRDYSTMVGGNDKERGEPRLVGLMHR
ncbi:hypothetical protein P167DRAFT_546142 [Morchella conica CCBAS932]|uniref:Uncharacterized protein n=1 Tax=Morchella conica CCBAS932 TaxID=1392247 RepID=A0A3N4KRC6_9PEZI|nr:hypothetical protein P167DRAFT_546142 [Morchella conica CCBAS932]